MDALGHGDLKLLYLLLPWLPLSAPRSLGLGTSGGQRLGARAWRLDSTGEARCDVAGLCALAPPHARPFHGWP